MGKEGQKFDLSTLRILANTIEGQGEELTVSKKFLKELFLECMQVAEQYNNACHLMQPGYEVAIGLAEYLQSIKPDDEVVIPTYYKRRLLEHFPPEEIANRELPIRIAHLRIVE